MYAMEIEAERRREVIGATKRDGRDGLRGHEKERRWSGTADVSLATPEPRTREGSITERHAVRG
jgi:hypothetical protein